MGCPGPRTTTVVARPLDVAVNLIGLSALDDAGLLATLIVYGRPAGAGSKTGRPIYRGKGPEREFTGHIAMTQDDKAGNTKRWRQAVVDATRQVIACDCPDPGCTVLRQPYPLDEPLEVSMVFTVAKPTSAPKTRRTWPATRPDVLKYARATEDALKDAGLYKDDARIVRYRDLAKVYPGEGPGALRIPGAVIRVWRMADGSPLPGVETGLRHPAAVQS